jgi:hypothetical protein
MKNCIRVAWNGHLAHPIPINWRVNQVGDDDDGGDDDDDQVGLWPRHFPSGADPFLKRFSAQCGKPP